MTTDLVAPGVRSLALAGLAVLLAITAAPGLAQEEPDPRPDMPLLHRRPILGFMLEPGPPPVVRRVLPDSPMARAGVRTGDVVLRIDGRDATQRRISESVRSSAPGDTIRMVIRRDGAQREIRVVPELRMAWPDDRVVEIEMDSIRAMTERILDGARDIEVLRFRGDSLAEIFHERFEPLRLKTDSLARRLRGHRIVIRQPKDGGIFDGLPALRGFLDFGGGSLPGARLAPLNPGLARHFAGADEGVLVLDVEPGTPAQRAGLEAGDVIVGANGRDVWSLDALRAALEGSETALAVLRDGVRHDLRLDRQAGFGAVE